MCLAQPWVTKDVLDLCDEMRVLKKKRYKAEGTEGFRKANKRIQKAENKAEEFWIGTQCEEIETCLNKNNSMRACQLVWYLTSEKQGRSSTIQGRSGKCLTEEHEILIRRIEYSQHYTTMIVVKTVEFWSTVNPPEEDLQQILRDEV